MVGAFLKKKSVRVIIVLFIILPIIGVVILKLRGASPPPVMVADLVTERTTSSGKVVGFSEVNGVHGWLGIPYAKAPVGTLRWKAPLPVEQWDGTLKALNAGAFCPQIGNPSIPIDGSMNGKPVGSEDCLFLNIWAPEHSPSEIAQGNLRLPVMFWIHGGGNSIGHGANYSGKVLAARHQVILVSINYRLGPMGWFLHPALQLDQKTAEDRSGNYGTLDIMQALTWVRDNITAFGGDPGNVTIFGESAGAFDTVSMLAAPKAKGLFHRAIIQSGGIRFDSSDSAQNFSDASVPGHNFSSKEVVNLMLVVDGKAGDRDAAKILQQKLSDQELRDYLRSKTPSDFLSVYQGFGFGMISFPNLIQDGTVLPAGNMVERFSNKNGYNSVPIMIGSNRDEFKLFLGFNPKYVDSYFKMIFRIKDKANYAAVTGYMSDAWKIMGVDRVAALLSGSQGPDVFAYRFDWDEEPTLLGTDFSFLLGAAHMLEVPFVFGSQKIINSFEMIYNDKNKPGWDALSESVTAYWAEFAHSGSPGQGRGNGQPLWKPWMADGGSYIVLDTPEDRGIQMSNNTTSMRDLKSRLLAETAIKDQKSHCEMYVMLFGDHRQFIGDPSLWNQQEYDSLGKEGCRAFPKNEFLR
jgi:para-nitrobenzyl esterase